MSYQVLLVLIIQISIINGAPMMLMPVPWMIQSAQQIALQKQLLELQAFQQLRAQSPVQTDNLPRPLLILLPKQEPVTNVKTNERLKLHKENVHNTDTNLENEDDDLSSVIIDALETSEEQDQPASSHPQRAILLIPNARLSIGGIVSAIPWLPIEINVPDTISWVYNGIASGIGSIISIIGRPFQGTQGAQVQEEGLKSILKQIQTNQNMFRPIVMMPIDGPVLLIQV